MNRQKSTALAVGAITLLVLVLSALAIFESTSAGSHLFGPRRTPIRNLDGPQKPQLPPGYVLHVSESVKSKGGGPSWSDENHVVAKYLTYSGALTLGWPWRYDLNPEIASNYSNTAQLDFELTNDSKGRQEEFQQVLREQLQLAFHMRVTPVKTTVRALMLTLPKGPPPGFRPAQSLGGFSINDSDTSTTFEGMTIRRLAEQVAKRRRCLIFDETGLPDRYDFTTPRHFETDKSLKAIGFTLSERAAEATYLRVDPE